ncbi:MAG: hypothetical protein DRJ34_03115 [Thermoprotei archaeon]|nr:MAG: hypothetical protein DRJ34_03115 [Thermoprotei archaeon]
MSDNKKIFEKITEYLNKLNLKYQYEAKNNRIRIPFILKVGEKKYTAYIYISWNEKWILCVTPLVRVADIPPEVSREEVYERLLLETYYLYEVTYGLTKDGYIVVHAETAVSALSFENFDIELRSIIFGVKYFIEKILPDFEELRSKALPIYV